MRIWVGIGKMMKKKMAGVNEKCSICKDFEEKKIKKNSNLFKTNSFFKLYAMLKDRDFE